jgi:hypothetical protein
MAINPEARTIPPTKLGPSNFRLLAGVGAAVVTGDFVGVSFVVVAVGSGVVFGVVVGWVAFVVVVFVVVVVGGLTVVVVVAVVGFSVVVVADVVGFVVVGAAVVVLFGGRVAGVDEWLGGIFVGEGMLSVWLLTIILPLTSVTAGVLTVVPCVCPWHTLIIINNVINSFFIVWI